MRPQDWIVGGENEWWGAKGPKQPLGDADFENAIGPLVKAEVPRAIHQNTVFLRNGGGFFKDTGSHAETMTPECRRVKDLIIYDKWSEAFICRLTNELRQKKGYEETAFRKKNSDSETVHTRGCHENYLCSQQLLQKICDSSLDPITNKVNLNAVLPEINSLILFLSTRQIMTGCGGVMLFGRSGWVDSYWISPRTHFINEVISTSSTEMTRGILHIKREALAGSENRHNPPKTNRLHLILGDANMHQMSVFLKFGTTAAVIEMIEAGFLESQLTMRNLRDAVPLLKAVSTDPTCRSVEIELSGGRPKNALEIQEKFLKLWRRYLEESKQGGEKSAIAEYWGEVLEKLRANDPDLKYWLDHKLKEFFLKTWMDKTGESLGSKKIAAIDLEFHNPNPIESVFYKYRSRFGDQFKELVSDEEIKKRGAGPPADTRAWPRVQFINLFEETGLQYEAEWDSVKFALPDDRVPHYKISLADPFEYRLAEIKTENESTIRILTDYLQKTGHGVLLKKNFKELTEKTK